jgi:hypothetical protein
MDDGFANVSFALGPCVYMLLYREQVVYVGKSKRVFQRIGQHQTMWDRAVRSKDDPVRRRR